MMTISAFAGIVSILLGSFALGYGIGYNQGYHHRKNDTKK